MKVAIFDIGQTLVLNQQSYVDYVKGQILKISQVFVKNLMESEFFESLNQEQVKNEDYQKEQLAIFEEQLLKNILDYKEKKNTEYVGTEKLFYQHMADTIIQIGLFGITQDLISGKEENWVKFCKSFMENPDYLHYDYKMMPFALEIVTKLKEQGMKIAACSNSNTPLKRIKILEKLGFNIKELFDAFVVSGDVNMRKPNPAILDLVKQSFPGVKNHEMFIVGDQIDRDIICGHDSGIRTVFFCYCPDHKYLNYQQMAKGINPDFWALDFRQLPTLIDIMNADCAYINQQSEEYQANYRDHIEDLPSQKRLKVGLMQDGDGMNQVDKFWKTGLLFENMDMGFKFLNLDENYWDCGKVDIILQKLQRIVPRYAEEESQQKIQRLSKWLVDEKLAIIDHPNDTMIINNRLLFLRKLQTTIEEIRAMEIYKDNPEAQKIRCPLYVDIFNDSDVQKVMADYKERAAQIQLNYPIVIKILQASQTEFAHSFYVVTSDKGMEEALSFPGFKDQLLLFQELLSHHEQLYKLYCIGEQFDYVIKTSLPHELVTSTDCYFFQTRMKFPPDSFTKFSKESRISKEILDIITKEVGIRKFGVNLFGVDLLVQEGTGNVYLIDINYYSSYDGLKNINVEKSFKDLIIHKYKENKEAQQ